MGNQWKTWIHRMWFNSMGNHGKIYVSPGIHRGSPIQRWVPLSNIIIKISHPEQWESDSAQENHTLPCNMKLKINKFEKLRFRFRDGTIRPPVSEYFISESIPSTRIKHRICDNVTGHTTSLNAPQPPPFPSIWLFLPCVNSHWDSWANAFWQISEETEMCVQCFKPTLSPTIRIQKHG